VRGAATDAAAVIFQQPNFFGCLEPAPDLARGRRREARCRSRTSTSISLGVLEAPGNYGCAMAIGEGSRRATP
jgi:glycine dehydrogenase subunit 1